MSTLYVEKFKNELLKNIIPFWLENSIDKEDCGYFTCLDQNGEVYDTDKFIWLQARQVYMFSFLYNNVEQKKEWLEAAIHGAEFLLNYGHDGKFNWYFALDKKGNPLIQPYNIFSYTFATLAFGQLAKATNEEIYINTAKETFQIILNKSNNPKGVWNKSISATRSLKNFALPMILCNLACENEHLISKEALDNLINECLHEVLEVFHRPELGGIIVENVTLDGKLSDTFDGRLINPGHAIEAMWFIMDLGVRLNREDLIQKAVEITLTMVEYGWDNEYGGIFYFMDHMNKPVQQLEWDQKLWWVHIETLISLSKGYQLTGSEKCLVWFDKVYEYTWNHFRDEKNGGEWFGYLNRKGEVLLSLKGGKWKGCFHVPRGLYHCWKTWEAISMEKRHSFASK